MVKRGDVCWADLPAGGRRPVLVLTRSEAIPVLREVIVILEDPITRLSGLRMQHEVCRALTIATGCD